MAIMKIVDPDSATADRPKQATGHTVDDRVGQDVYIIGGLTLDVDIDPADIVDVSGLAQEEGGNLEDLKTAFGVKGDGDDLITLLRGLLYDQYYYNLLPNVIANPNSLTGFDSSGCTLSLDDPIHDEAEYSIKGTLTETGWASIVMDGAGIDAIPSLPYNISFYTKGTAGKTVYPYVYVKKESGGDLVMGDPVTLTGEVQRISIQTTAAAAATNLIPYIWMDGAAGDVFRWGNAQITQTPVIKDWIPGESHSGKIKVKTQDDLFNLLESLVESERLNVTINDNITIAGDFATNESVAPMVALESFDESDLVSDDYTVVFTPSTGIMGVGITNNSEENSLTMAIGDVDIVVPATKSFYDLFLVNSTITVTGTTPDFDAYIEGAYLGEEE